MLAIWKREFKSYFHTVIGWLFMTVTLALFGLYFYLNNILYGYSKLSNTLSGITFIFLLTVPLLTMRALAEEKKNKTDQLILTAPVSVGKIVLAKYLAMASIYTIVVAIIALSPLFLRIFGTVPFGETYVGVLGFWLYGLTCIAVGTFISSLTESQVIAAVLTFVFLFLGYMMDGICSLISTSGNVITRILGCYDLVTRLDNFFGGMLDLGAIVYYVSVIALFLFLTVQSIQKRRWSMSRKKLGLGVFNTGMVAVMVALTVFLNLVVGAIPSTNTQLDATDKKLYTITDDTKNMLQNMEDDVTIYVLAAESEMDETVAMTLERYGDSSSHISVVYKDPAKNPSFFTKYTTDTSLTKGSLIIESAKRYKVVNYAEMYEGTYDSSYQWTTTGYDGEGRITSAIQYVISDNMPVVYAVTGHNETSITGGFETMISKANMEMQELTLLKVDAIPEDASAIIINGPTTDFSADDAQKVIDYLEAGGKAFISTTYTESDMTNFFSILEKYGVTMANGIVLENDSNYYYQQPYYLLPEIATADMTANATDYYVFAPSAQGLQYTEESGISYTPLVTTSEASYCKTDVANIENLDQEEGDMEGPFYIGLDLENSETGMRMAVYSCTGMFVDNADAMVSGNNADLFSDAMTNLVSGEGEESTVVIPVKEFTSETLTIPTAVALITSLVVIFVLPLGLLIVGLVIWLKRRKK